MTVNNVPTPKSSYRNSSDFMLSSVLMNLRSLDQLLCGRWFKKRERNNRKTKYQKDYLKYNMINRMGKTTQGHE